MNSFESRIGRFCLITASSLLIVAAFVGAHLRAQADEWAQAPREMKIYAPKRLPDAVAEIARDPFAGVTKSPTAVANAPGAPNAAMPSIPNGLPVPGGQVPNPGSVVPSGGAPEATLQVEGVVLGLGHAPVAMIKNGTDTDFVHVGDYLGSHKIVSIQQQGIEFDDGTRLAVATAPANLGPSAPSGQFIAPGGPTGAGVNPAPPAPIVPVTPTPVPTLAPNDVPTVGPGNYNMGPPPTPAPGSSPQPILHQLSPQPSST